MALVAYNGAMVVYNTVQGISNGLRAIAAARTALNTGMSIAEAAATKTATGAQVGLNAAFLACPITWIVGGIILLIATIYAGVAVFNKFGYICQRNRYHSWGLRCIGCPHIIQLFILEYNSRIY